MGTRADPRPVRFIIWTPTFDETSGGTISLHLLCHRLNEAGEEALIWPSERPRPSLRRPRTILSWLKHVVTGRERGFSTGPFPNRIARPADVEGAIVVYPEITNGNPVKGEHVVRWFLHRPGHLTGVRNYGKDELYFYILAAFNDEEINPNSDNKLSIVWFNPVYRDEGRTDRQGSCYLMRKETGRELTHDLADSIRIDALSHAEKADEFSRRRYFYSYDPYTMYSTYAAICGCIPIVMKLPGVSREEWHPREQDRWGMAYGEEDIPYAVETRGKLLARLERWRADEDRMLADFIRKCKAWVSGR